MRYQANISENLDNAIASQDIDLAKDILINSLAFSIEERPDVIIDALKSSNVKLSDNPTKKELADKVAYAFASNPIFQKNISVVLGTQEEQRVPVREEFYNAVDPVTAVANAVGSIFQTVQTQQQTKLEEEKTKQLLYMRLFGEEEKKTNWIPIIVIAGVLLIGGIVVWRVTKK